MHPRPLRGRRWSAAVAATAAAGLVVAGVWAASGSASAGTITGSLYVDPDTQAARWVAANPNDSRTPVIRDKIASQPQARWFASFNVSTARSDASSFVNAANAVNQVPVASVYEIPNRDCGGASAGGAPDMTQYQTWVSNFSQGLGDRTVIIILETDSIALQTCLSSSELTERNNALSTATRTIKSANANAKVYLDGGHSAWNSAATQASRLRDAGIQYADGFYTNVSNFQPTASEASYGRSIISSLEGMGISGKHQIIDTSRNGGAAGDWCADDDTDRRIGQYPTLDTGDANIDGYLWVKLPGEADGCQYTAGSFQPALAYSLASSAPYPSSPAATTAPPSSSSVPPSSTSPSQSVSPSSPPITGGIDLPCTASFRAVSSWGSGYQGEVTVTIGQTAVAAWTVTMTLASGQSVSQVWNATLTGSGSTLTLRNVAWNGALNANASTTFGFIASGGTTAPTLACSGYNS